MLTDIAASPRAPLCRCPVGHSAPVELERHGALGASRATDRQPTTCAAGRANYGFGLYDPCIGVFVALMLSTLFRIRSIEIISPLSVPFGAVTVAGAPVR